MANNQKMRNEFKFKIPRLFKAASRIIKSVKEEGSDIAELVNQYKKQTSVKALSALVQKVLENVELIDQLIEKTGILENQKDPDPWLYRVLITQLLLGKKRLPVGCRQIQTVLAFGPQLTIELKKMKMSERAKSNAEESSSEVNGDEALSEEEDGPSQKKAKQQRKKKKKKKNNKVSTEQPELVEEQLTIEHRKLKKGERAENNTEESSDDEALSEEEERPSQKKAKQQRKKKNKVSTEQLELVEDQLTIEHRKLKKGERAESNTEEPSDDEALSEEEEGPPQKKAKQQKKKKNKIFTEQPESSEDQSTIKQRDKTTPRKSQNSDAEKPKSAAKKLEDYISIKSSNIKAKHGRNFGMHPKLKKFMSPKQRNIQKVQQFVKRSHSQTPKGKNFGKDKLRYFEVPLSV